ncbi:MAG: hypothetical protein MJ178_06680 [Treponemataceae bacterium]|nr:hypothetical protein [Treponemataceae bacterium]
MVDKAYKHWTGQDLDHSTMVNGKSENTGFVKLGQEFVDPDSGYTRKATMADVMQQSQHRGLEASVMASDHEKLKNMTKQEVNRKVPDEDGLGR